MGNALSILPAALRNIAIRVKNWYWGVRPYSELGEQASVQKDASEPRERAAASCLSRLPSDVGAGMQRKQGQLCPRREVNLSHLR